MQGTGDFRVYSKFNYMARFSEVKSGFFADELDFLQSLKFCRNPGGRAMLGDMNLLKTPLSFGLVCALAVTAPLLKADLLVQETFSYANGALDGQNGGTGFAGAWSGAAARWTVADGVAKVGGTGNGSVTRELNKISLSTNNTVYFSFDLTVLSSGATAPMNDALAFEGWNGTSTVSLFGLGIAHNATTTQVRSTYSTSTTPNGTYNNFGNDALLTGGATNTLVVKLSYTPNSTSATLSFWMNPEKETDATFRSVNILVDQNLQSISSLVLRRQDGTAAGAVGTSFDNIRIGTDWDSVTASTIPEPGVFAATAGAAALGIALTARRR